MQYQQQGGGVLNALNSLAESLALVNLPPGSDSIQTANFLRTLRLPLTFSDNVVIVDGENLLHSIEPGLDIFGEIAKHFNRVGNPIAETHARNMNVIFTQIHSDPITQVQRAQGKNHGNIRRELIESRYGTLHSFFTTFIATLLAVCPTLDGHDFVVIHKGDIGATPSIHIRGPTPVDVGNHPELPPVELPGHIGQRTIPMGVQLPTRVTARVFTCACGTATGVPRDIDDRLAVALFLSLKFSRNNVALLTNDRFGWLDSRVQVGTANPQVIKNIVESLPQSKFGVFFEAGGGRLRGANFTFRLSENYRNRTFWINRI